jgi:hypothetical protein
MECVTDVRHMAVCIQEEDANAEEAAQAEAVAAAVAAVADLKAKREAKWRKEAKNQVGCRHVPSITTDVPRITVNVP